jgi:hypothetical protein
LKFFWFIHIASQLLLTYAKILFPSQHFQPFNVTAQHFKRVFDGLGAGHAYAAILNKFLGKSPPAKPFPRRKQTLLNVFGKTFRSVGENI